jgi:hypothetical protein
VFPVRYELNLYILFAFRMILTINSDVSINGVSRLVFLAET